MEDIPLSVLISTLIILIIISGFFSGSETGLMTLNRYRLRHLAKIKHPGAVRASRLLKRTDRLIGLILLGNNFVNILASIIAGIIALRLWGQAGLLITPVLLTIIVLIFAEVTPKTLAALHPEKFSFPATFILEPLLKILSPFVWIINVISNGILKLLGVTPELAATHSLSSEELRTVVNEAGAMIPVRHQKMLTSILDLENVSVDDIMIPRGEIVGIDLEDEWDEIVNQLHHSQHTRLPVYNGGIENVIGLIHIRNVLHLIGSTEFNADEFLKVAREPYFIPEGTPLNTQLLNFQHQKRRIALVVDEYGDIQGLVTLEDILEEIVGEFTTDPAAMSRDINPQKDGSYLIDGSTNIRDINKLLGWSLPTDGPKTLNGLILEHMETIPESGTSLMLSGYPVDILQVMENAVKTVKISPLPVQALSTDKT